MIHFSSIFITSLFALIFYVTVIQSDPLSSPAELQVWGISNRSDSDLVNKTLELKQLALKIIQMRGVDAGNQSGELNVTRANWDDMQMTQELYENLKATFDEELKKLEANKSGDIARATAPDFALIPMSEWTDMPIKFTLSLVKSLNLKKLIRKALDEIQSKSGCLSFEEVNSRPSGPFILYLEHPTLGDGVCADSPLGKQASGNTINVASTCQVYGTLIHETLHSLGFAHTQQRPDADQYVTLHWDNIVYEARTNFKPWKYALRNQGDFDFGSIMMYPRDAFAINPRRDTITPRVNPSRNGALMGQRDHLSDEDVNLLKKIYCGARGGSSSGGKTSLGGRTVSKKECKDEFFVSCGYFKLRGYCTSTSTFSNYVQEHCAKTCQLC